MSVIDQSEPEPEVGLSRAMRCRSCGAPIRWASTARGKAIPLNADPVAGGNVVILDGEATVIPQGTYLAGKDHYVSHFATCPQAAQHRRK